MSRPLRSGEVARATGVDLETRADAKLREIEARIADLHLVGDTLRSARAAGCDHLIARSHDPACPIPFAELAGTTT